MTSKSGCASPWAFQLAGLLLMDRRSLGRFDQTLLKAWEVLGLPNPTLDDTKLDTEPEAALELKKHGFP